MKPSDLEEISEFIQNKAPGYKLIILVDDPNGQPVNSIVIFHTTTESALNSMMEHARHWLTSEPMFNLMLDHMTDN